MWSTCWVAASISEDGSLILKQVGANAFKLGGRTATSTGVPYFRSEAINSYTALDIVPNGDGGAEMTGKAWIHILNVDLPETADQNWQALVLAAQGDKVTLGSDFGASSTNLPLHIGGRNIVFQDRGKSPSTSFGQWSATGLQVGVVGAAKQSLTPADVRLASDIEIKWSATTDVFGTLDTGIQRLAAGVVQINGGSTTAPAAAQLYTYAASPPGAPAAGNCRLYADTSGGKIRLMALFPSGEAQPLAIEP